MDPQEFRRGVKDGLPFCDRSHLDITESQPLESPDSNPEDRSFIPQALQPMPLKDKSSYDYVPNIGLEGGPNVADQPSTGVSSLLPLAGDLETSNSTLMRFGMLTRFLPFRTEKLVRKQSTEEWIPMLTGRGVNLLKLSRIATSCSSPDIISVHVAPSSKIVAILMQLKFAIFKLPSTANDTVALECIGTISGFDFQHGPDEAHLYTQRDVLKRIQKPQFSTATLSNDHFIAALSSGALLVFSIEMMGKCIRVLDETTPTFKIQKLLLDRHNDVVAVFLRDSRAEREEVHIYALSDLICHSPSSPGTLDLPTTNCTPEAIIGWDMSYNVCTETGEFRCFHQVTDAAFSLKGDMIAISSNQVYGRCLIRILVNNGAWKYWGGRLVQVLSEDSQDWGLAGVTGIASCRWPSTTEEFIALALDTTVSDIRDCFSIIDEGDTFRLSAMPQRQIHAKESLSSIAIAASADIIYGHLALLTRDGQLHFVRQNTRIEMNTRTKFTNIHHTRLHPDLVALSFSPDGRRLIMLDHTGVVQIFNFEGIADQGSDWWAPSCVTDTTFQSTGIFLRNILPGPTEPSKETRPTGFPGVKTAAETCCLSNFRTSDRSVNANVESRLTLRYPVYAMEMLQKYFESIRQLLEKDTRMSVENIFAGFDVLPQGSVQSIDDEDFFTGMREVIWLGTASVDVSLEIYGDIAEDIAELVKPIPIVVVREFDQKVILVHDKFFSLFPSDRFRQVPTPTPNTSSGGPSFTEIIHSQSLAPRSPLPVTNTGGSTSREREPPASGDRYPTAYPPASRETTSPINDSRANHSFPEDPRDPSGSVTADVNPFTGRLTVEDSRGVEQSAQIVMGLELATPNADKHAIGTDIFTQVTIESLEMTLSAPQCAHQQSSKISETHPLLDPKDLRIKITPSGGNQVTTAHQVPLNCDELLKKNITTSSENCWTVSAKAGPSPSATLGFGKRAAKSADCDPLCQCIDDSKSDVREVGNSRVWRYVLKESAKDGLRLPPHSCIVSYSSDTPVTSMEISVDVCLETRNKSTKSNRSSTRLVLGYKHVKMCLTLDVKRETGRRFLNLQGQQRNGSTVTRLHRFPADGQSSKNVSYTNKLVTASLEMEANNDRRKT